MTLMQVSLPSEAGPWLFWPLVAALVLAALEGVVMTVRRQGYDWRAFAASLGDVLGRRFVDALGLSITVPALAWVHAHRRGDLALAAPVALAVLFIGQEFCYYWYHRAAHRMAWFWATHCVHHSPNQLTLGTALRLGWTGKLTGTGLFFAPLVWLGFPPQAVLGALAANLLYQFWLHAAWMPRLGPLEWIFNTPSHHRVHHGSNDEYLDCNFGGVLIVFDRLFGTFVEERRDLVIRYGLTEPVTSYNPLKIAVHGWIQLWRRLRAEPRWGERAKMLVRPPGG
ncbi:Sterol desaturase/sphingolipid hydroxylase, fatty acid hydroxylase superfamily [Roseateles sp. YR242]|uniref:sterol desaturase family protein n=1 Tax=Roseateles sp. YR242 TaxID=1855305 RepID=UPI0008B5B7A9|nr:sterol desaturase family protein [Roseateles sp. YR242]SEL58322.1 Sterol desaturase/sphingolipid hydroxylase, fatty acid hydroxylase superfamily [Roseateles sp. YR242]